MTRIEIYMQWCRMQEIANEEIPKFKKPKEHYFIVYYVGFKEPKHNLRLTSQNVRTVKTLQYRVFAQSCVITAVCV